MLETVQSTPLTFYSSRFYIQLARQWQGIGFGFIILLTLINVVWVGTQTHEMLHESGQEIAAAVSTLPAFTFKDHKLSIDQPSPFSVVLFKNDTFANKLVIDTNLVVKDMPALIKRMDKENIVALLTADTIVTKKTDGETNVNTYDKLSPQTITHEQWASLAKIIGKGFVAFCFACVAIGFLFLEFVAVVFIAVAAKFIAAMMRVSLDFSAAMRLSAASHMPIGIVATFLPIPPSASAIVWVGFTIFGLISVRRLGKQAI